VKPMLLTTCAAFGPLIVRMAMTLLLKIVARLPVTSTTLSLRPVGALLLPYFQTGGPRGLLASGDLTSATRRIES
jgi:hypothetical protein